MTAPLIKDMETAVAGVLKISAELKTRSNPPPSLGLDPPQAAHRS